MLEFSGSVLEKNGSGSRLFPLNKLNLFNKAEFSNFCLIFFMLKLDESFRNQEIFIISLFSIVQIWGLRVTFFPSVFVDILHLGSGSREPKS